jgi:hypothetical protein
MNNKEREQWINNDEGLYKWWKSTCLSMTRFIKEHRQEIDEYINKVLNRKG